MQGRRSQQTGDGDLSVRRIHMEFESIPPFHISLAVPFHLPVTCHWKFRHHLVHRHGHLPLNTGRVRNWCVSFGWSPTFLFRFCLPLLPDRWLLPCLYLRAVLRNMTEQMIGKRSLDERFMHPLAQPALRELGKHPRKGGLTWYLASFPSAYTPQHGVGQKPVSECTGGWSIIHRFRHKRPPQSFAVGGRPAKQMVVKYPIFNADNLQNGGQFQMIRGERPQFLFQKGKQTPLNPIPYGRYCLHHNPHKNCCQYIERPQRQYIVFYGGYLLLFQFSRLSFHQPSTNYSDFCKRLF